MATACGGDDDATPHNYPLPSYSFLTPLRLNVASIEIDDRTAAVPGNSIESQSPIRPVDALKQMAKDRLVAGGSNGRAIFVIDRASLTRAGSGIDGVLAVHLDVFAGAGSERAGYAEARVARRRTSNDGSDTSRAVLYEFTMQMMNDMNVEFEFQVKRSLRDWLQATAGTAPPPPPVQAQDLGSPSGRPALRP